MKKILVVASVLLLVALLISGCKQQVSTTTATTTATTAVTATKTTEVTATKTTEVTTTKTTATKTLKIGGLMSLTGFMAINDTPEWQQTVIAADLINEKGGITINGETYMIQTAVEDCKSTMDGVTAAANLAVDKDGVKFIIGPTAFFASASAPVLTPAKVLNVLTWSTHAPGEMDASTPYTFIMSHSSVPVTEVTLNYMHQAYPNVKKVAVVAPDDGTKDNVLPKVRPFMEKLGISQTGDIILFANETVDLSPQVTKILALKDADGVLIVNGLSPHFGAITKGLRAAGDYQPICISTAAPIHEIMTIAGTDACKDVSVVSITPGDPNNPPLMAQIIERTISQYGADVSLQCRGADGLYMLKEAFEATQSLDPTVVKNWIESQNTIDTLFGTATVCGKETFGINNAVIGQLAVQIEKDGTPVSAGWINIGAIP